MNARKDTPQTISPAVHLEFIQNQAGLAEAESVEEIEAYFVQRFGQKTVGTPTTPAATLLTIVLPFGLIALIGVGIAVTLIRWRSSQMHDTEPSIEAAPASDPYRERLEADLKDKA